MKNFRTAVLCCGLYIVSISLLTPAVTLSQETNQEEELFFVAQKAFDDGFYDVAIRYIDQFLQKFPATKHYAKARLLYGQCFFFKNQYLKAFEIFQSLVSESSIKDASFYWLAETYFKGSDYRQAQLYYQKIIDQFPESKYLAQAYYSLGWSFFDQGDYQSALKYFNHVIQKFPDHAVCEDALFKIGESYLNSTDYPMAIDSFENYIQRYPKSDKITNAHFYLAESYYYVNDFLKANTYYAKAAEQSTDAYIAYMSEIGMGWIYLKLKKYNLSENHFTLAKQLADKNDFSLEEVMLGQAALFTETERHHDAADHYREFLRLFPDSPKRTDAMIGKANALYFLQEYDKAISSYQDIIHATAIPMPPELMQKVYYGIAWSFLNQGKLADAIKTFKTIVEKTENPVIKASALSQIGDAYQGADQFTEALKNYDIILNTYADGPYADYAQFQQGITLLKMNDINAALSSLLSLKSNFPKSDYLNEANYYLGFAHFQHQEWERAGEYITKFLSQNDHRKTFTTQARYILALASFYQKKYQEAIDLFKEVVTSSANEPSVQQTAEIFIGKTLFHLNKTNEAIKYFRQICQLYPSTEAHQDALLWLGSYYLEALDFKNAVLYYTAFIDKFSDSDRIDVAYYELGQTYQGQGFFDQALKLFNKVSPENDPEIFAKSQLAIAEIFSREMGEQKALKTYEKIAAEIPAYKRDALVQIAKIYEQNDNPQKAITIYEEALNAKQGSSEISNDELHFSIADNYELLNKSEKAIEQYLRIPYLSGERTSLAIKAYLRIARIFEHNNDWAQAHTTYQKIIDLNIDESKYARERIEWIENQGLTMKD